MRNRLDPPTATGGEDMKALDKFVEAKKAGGPNFGVRWKMGGVVEWAKARDLKGNQVRSLV